MGKSQNRVGEEHARPGVAHYPPDFFTLSRHIAMHQAFAAGGLVFLERAMTQALKGVGEELLTIITEPFFASVSIPAKTMEHYFHSPGFPLYTS